jgi:hypothetical protein
LVAAGQHNGGSDGNRSRLAMADGVDPGMYGDQLTGGDPVVDRVSSEAQGSQLTPGHMSVLWRGQL